MRNNQGFLLEEALICIALCSVMCMAVSSVFLLEIKKEENMNKLEEEINQSWEELFAELQECQACPIEQDQEAEIS